ncbi:hypothetical protein [Streptomyces nigra]|uniref:hypothetical protein n=1 Tax=Streptomyces nigra TaxID=1827580 RepID=UPI0038233C9B
MEGGEGRPSEIVIPPEFVKLEGVLNEDDLNAVLAWSRDHHGQFITETVLTPDNGPDVATENTVRVLDDLGELGARIAARIRDEVLVAATHGGPTGMPGEQPRLGDSVALRMFEVDAEFEIHPPASDTGIGVVLYLTVPTTPRLRLHEGRQMGDTAVAGANSVEVATEANVAVVFAAQNTVVVNAGIEPSDAEDRSCALVIAGHLGA